LISETYGPGSALLSVRPGECEVLWQDEPDSRDKALQCHWSTPMLVDGFLYGCSGRHADEAELRCIEWATGRVAWSEPWHARFSLTHIDGHLLFVDEFGRLTLVQPDPAVCKIVASINLGTASQASSSTVHEGPPLTHPVWAGPALAGGKLFLRGRNYLLCLDLSEVKLR
jgi:hypothetical protein